MAALGGFVGAVLALAGFGLIAYGFFVVGNRPYVRRQRHVSSKVAFMAPYVWGGAVVVWVGLWLQSVEVS